MLITARTSDEFVEEIVKKCPEQLCYIRDWWVDGERWDEAREHSNALDRAISVAGGGG